MFGDKSMLVVLGTSLFCVAAGSAQQTPPGDTPNPRSIHLNVIITTASGQCVTDLQQKDFKILDNNLPQTITSFRAVTISPKQVEVPDRAYSAGNGADTGCYQQGELFQYEITFNVPSNAGPNEYHGVEVKVYKPNLTVRTRRGYFTEP